MTQGVNMTRDLITSPCPHCGHVQERETYDIGSGRELCCVVCDWCWGADGQPLIPITVNRMRKVLDEVREHRAKGLLSGAAGLLEDDDGAPYPEVIQNLVRASVTLLRHSWVLSSDPNVVRVPPEDRQALAEVLDELGLSQ